MIGKCCMSVFTWFKLKKNKLNYKNNKSIIEQELKTFKSCTKWPIAKMDDSSNLPHALFLAHENTNQSTNNRKTNRQRRFTKKLA